MPNHLDDKLIFQPNSTVLKAWLKTRKRKFSVNGYVHPGFFCTHLFGWDAFFAILGISIEIIIFIFFLSKVDLSSLGNWVALPIIILLDLVFIFTLVHQNKSRKVTYENAVPFLEDDEHPLLAEKANTLEKLRSMLKIGTFNFVSSLGIGLEWLSCFVKIYFIHLAYGLSIEPISIAIVVGYLIQTNAYVYSAGYFFWELLTRSFISRQNGKFNKLGGQHAENNPFIAKALNLPFESSTKLKPIQYSSFNLIKEGDSNYRLEVIGIPVDSEIVDFALKQDDKQARWEIMSHCHKIQLIKFDNTGD